MAETPRYRATPVPGFLSTARQIPRSIWRTVRVGGIKIRNAAVRAGHWLRLKTARPVLAADRNVRRGGRGLWRFISATPTYMYRGLGYVARVGSFFVREMLAGVAIIGLGLALLGLFASKTTEVYDAKVHQNTVAWSQGVRIPLKPASDFYDTDAPDYHADDEEAQVQEEADKVVDELSKSTGLNEEQIKEALRQVVLGGKLDLTPPEPGQFTKEDYPILEREVEIDGVPVWQEMRYEEIDTAIRDAQGRKELYVALGQLTSEQVEQRWLMMKERARFLGDHDRASYYFGRELATGQLRRLDPRQIDQMSPQAMSDYLASTFSNPQVKVPEQTNEQQLRSGVKHEWARIKDARRAEATRRNAQQQRESKD